MAQRFGEMLMARRRQMGVSLQQAANVIKMRPQIVEYFETENFAAMPPRGYAQGMIASYARFLGLNPREVVDAYFDALDEYEHSGGRAGRFQDAAADANPRSSHMPGRYEVLDAPAMGSRFAQRPPQAGYVSESTSEHEPMSSSRLRPARVANSRRRPAAGEFEPGLRSRTNRGYREGYAEDGYRPRGNRRGDGAPRPANGQRRRPGLVPGQPDRYFDTPRGSRAQGTYRGGARAGSRGGGRPPQQGSSLFSMFPFDPKFLLTALVAVLLVVVLSVVLLMRGCAPKEKAPAGSNANAVQSVDTSGDTSGDSADADDADGSSTDDNAKDGDKDKAKKDESAESKETVVKIKVDGEGVVAWVEVNLDGKSVLGKQVVAPFEQEFKVSSQIDITTDTPSNVTVYKNGKKVRYDTKVSGVAKVSIAAPKIEMVDLTVDTDDDGIADMTEEDALNEGYDVESRTVDKVTIPKEDYLAGSSVDADSAGDSGDADDSDSE